MFSVKKKKEGLSHSVSKLSLLNKSYVCSCKCKVGTYIYTNTTSWYIPVFPMNTLTFNVDLIVFKRIINHVSVMVTREVLDFSAIIRSSVVLSKGILHLKEWSAFLSFENIRIRLTVILSCTVLDLEGPGFNWTSPLSISNSRILEMV